MALSLKIRHWQPHWPQRPRRPALSNLKPSFYFCGKLFTNEGNVLLLLENILPMRENVLLLRENSFTSEGKRYTIAGNFYQWGIDDHNLIFSAQHVNSSG